MSSFISYNDLATFLGTDLSADDAARAEAIIAAASEIIRAYTRQTITQGTTTADLPGTWTSDLDLPERPVTAVSAVSANGTPLTVNADYYWNDRGTLRRGAAFDTPLASTASWGGPQATVTVTYTHGYATIPQAIKSVCLAIAARVFSNPAGLAGEMLGTYQVQYDRTAANMALTDLEKALLKPYRRLAQ